MGSVLDFLDEQGLAQDTIVMYSTANGPHVNTWPDAGMTPFRNEKNSNWEGAYRVPAMIRWPVASRQGRSATASSATTTGSSRFSLLQETWTSLTG